MICNNCGNNIDENLNFCPHCGNQIQKHITCRACNNSIDSNLNFCPYCGTSTKQYTNNQNDIHEQSTTIITNSYTQEEPKPRLIIGVITALLIDVLGLIIAMIVLKDKPYERNSFLKGWIPTFVGIIILNIITYVIIFIASPYSFEEIIFNATEITF